MRIHGHAEGGKRTSTYGIWENMKRRCQNPSCDRYKDYGGRGITVCDRWQKFENFLEDMGERPNDLTLDRTNNDGNYEPGNCRWATRVQQSRNSRKAKLTEDDAENIRSLSVTFTQTWIANLFGVSQRLVWNIINSKAWK